MADPYLHNASVEIHDVSGGGDEITDVVTERLGLRSVAVDADTDFRLNGSHLHLLGVNLHHDRADKGWAISDADHTQDFDLISEIGANAVRMARQWGSAQVRPGRAAESGSLLLSPQERFTSQDGYLASGSEPGVPEAKLVRAG